ncbi:MAG: DUF2461 domain-containing protein [Pseudomonadota bacterium]
MSTKSTQFFTERSVRFLRSLRKNNNRDWFNEHKSEYELQVLDPALRFIDAMQDPLEEIAPNFTAVPKRVGGSLMRIYRDTRFAKDKTPYKTNIGIQFRHELGKDVHAPGFYVHIDPDQVFIGAGMWRPHSEPLAKIRHRIADKQAEWRRALADKSFRRHFELSGESLTRPPRGFSKEHPLIDDIKRKDFIAVKNLDHDAVIAPTLVRRVKTALAAAEPFMRFLCKAVDVKY